MNYGFILCSRYNPSSIMNFMVFQCHNAFWSCMNYSLGAVNQRSGWQGGGVIAPWNSGVSNPKLGFFMEAWVMCTCIRRALLSSLVFIMEWGILFIFALEGMSFILVFQEFFICCFSSKVCHTPQHSFSSFHMLQGLHCMVVLFVLVDALPLMGNPC